MANSEESLTGAEAIQSIALEYILDAKDQTDDFMEKLSEIAKDMQEETDQFENLFDYPSTALPTFQASDITKPPAEPKIAMEVTPFAASFDQVAVPTMDTGTGPGEFTKAAPGIGTYAFPDPLEGFTGTAPTVSYGAVPTLTDPDAVPVPTISETVIPVVPGVTIPTFIDTLSAEAPPVTLPGFAHSEAKYTSLLLTEATNKLMYDLMNGGYGIEVEDEQRLWGRAMEREARLMEVGVQEVARELTSKGFDLPPGAYYARVDEARRQSIEKMSDVSRDIAIKRADMFVENRKFTIEQTREFENLLSNIYGSYMERALKASMATVEMGIAIYNANIASVNAKIAVFKAKVDAYETSLKSALAPLEAAKVQLEAAKLESSIKRDVIDIYTARVNAATQFVQMQRARLEAYSVGLEAEKSKIELYKTEVDIYIAKSQAKSLELQAYKARIEGDVAQISGFESEVRAYNALVETYKARVQAKAAEIDAVVRSNAGNIAAFEAKASAYKTNLDAQSTVANTKLKLYQGQIEAWAKQADIELQRRGQEYDVVKDERQVRLKQAEGKMQHAIAKYKEIQETNKILMNYNDNIAKTMLQYMSGLFSQAVGISADIKTIPADTAE